MSSGVASSVSPSLFSGVPTKSKITHCSSPSLVRFRSSSTSSNLKFRPSGSLRFIASCSSGDGDNRTVLDAFFLGKAFAETLTERVESTVGVVLSEIGRLQAERQQQIIDFQEEVIERAKKAKEKAERDAKEAQGPISSSIISATIEVTSSPTASSNGQQRSSPNAYSETVVNQDPPRGDEE
ncbi:uncharacterized protein At4g13200, chloroplastic-like [Cucurbita pepo subsp. pepo]|uniref:uncharacterized protein At4g13200, chloroplastic-like n=1 Tax=Cucurbita pepo subsp. pepo TaxID=3664 RepID=UPI000C9D3588|nr:uncharacterized protein At4g13200, chloroplastic-like [Cucurbita pepo subsp. pepo]